MKSIHLLFFCLLFLTCKSQQTQTSASATATIPAIVKETPPPPPAKAEIEPQPESPAAEPKDTYGTIRGKVIYDGGEVHKTLNVIKDETTCGSEDLVDESLLTDANGGIKWAVVSIDSEVKNGKPLDELPGDRVLNQHMCQYQPHVVLVGVGQKLTINNHDHTLHNVRTASFMNDPYNKVQIYVPGTPPPSDTTTFSEPEVVDVLCDVHGWMKAYIHVVEHPYYAVTGDDGSFEITKVPPGKYTLKVWQEKLGETTATVEVKAGETAEITFHYPAK